jgi:hypothetical protein
VRKLSACLFIVIVTAGSMLAGRSSATYFIPADSVDTVGTHSQSANYSINGNAAGEFGVGANAVATSSAYSTKNGFVGELYDIVSLSVTAPPSNNLNEETSRQLYAAPQADDTTTLANLDPTTVTWSVVSGPITSITAAGLVTADNVYQDTPSTVGGSAQGLSGQLTLTILDTNPDDYGIYANDGIPDSWQVQYFGVNNPQGVATADADGTGQNNLFKYIAGLNPVDGSRFALSIQTVPGQPSQKQLVLQPIVSGRTYTPQFTTGLTNPNWQAVSNTMQSDNGSIRTITDLGATPAPRFYRIQISKP